LLVFCSGVLETLRVETLVMRFLEKFQIAPVIVTREQGERKRLYVYTILCKPRDEIESQERGDSASFSLTKVNLSQSQLASKMFPSQSRVFMLTVPTVRQALLRFGLDGGI